MLNKVTLIGRIGRAPETRRMSSGDQVMNFSIATDEKWRDKSTGEKREKTEWHNVVVFSERVINFLERYAEKGTQLYVEGALQTRKWTDQSGQERYTTEVVVKQFNGDVKIIQGGKRNDDAPSQHQEPDQKTPADLDDDIPF